MEGQARAHGQTRRLAGRRRTASGEPREHGAGLVRFLGRLVRAADRKQRPCKIEPRRGSELFPDRILGLDGNQSVRLVNRRTELIQSALSLSARGEQDAERTMGWNELSAEVDVGRSVGDGAVEQGYLPLAKDDRRLQPALRPLGIGGPCERGGELLLVGHIGRIERGQILHRAHHAIELPRGFDEMAFVIKHDADVLDAEQAFPPPSQVVRLDCDQLVREALVFAIGGHRPTGLAPKARELAEPEDILRMVEQPLGIFGRPPDRLRRAGHRLPVEPIRFLQVPAQIGHLGHEVESPRTLQERGVGQLRRVLPLVIVEDP